ncbi:MAG: ATP-binding cassette domain-containing protein [Candidatus Caccovivens sp.]
MKNILEVKNLTVMIKERFLVQNASFAMHKGDCIGIVGEDKSGKTSLLKAISGSLPISDGQVLIDGKDILEDKSALSEVNICLDPPVFFKFQTVFNNLQYLSMLKGDVDKEQIIKVLNQFGLAHKMKRRVLFLSYFEKKLMALALAFLTEPKLLLLDEPFKGLPADKIKELKEDISLISSRGTSVIISSRHLEHLEDVCKNFIFMEDRRIKEILSLKDCEKYSTHTTYAFVSVKYPHYCGKLIQDNFNLDVKLYGKKVLFIADEDQTAEIVKFFTQNRIAVYKAGYLSRKSEKIFADLAPYFKEEE